MKQSLKSKIIYLPKIIIFGLALLNFFYVKSHTSLTIFSGGKLSFPAYTPWYETSDVNVIWIILAASICLLISRRSSYLIAGVFSGYFTIIGFIHLFLRNMTLLERWQGIRRVETDVFLAYEVQWILAATVFSATVFYLIREVTRKNLS